MAFYDLPIAERRQLVARMEAEICRELEARHLSQTLLYMADADTYIRKSAYLAFGRIYLARPDLQAPILQSLEALLEDPDFKIRQTLINAAGAIGKVEFEKVRHFFDRSLFDSHHSPRNAVIGSLKKMGEVNPGPVLAWAREYLHHADKEIRREICHGIELRGRKYPEDILPMLEELQHDPTARVRDTLVHVLGQIAYKRGCLATVVAHLRHWSNQALVAKALEEIIDVHHRYRDFAVLSQDEARAYIAAHF